MPPTDDPMFAQLMQAQIASAEAAKHLMQQESFGFKNPGGEAVRIVFGLPKRLPAKDVIEVLDEYILALHAELNGTCEESESDV
jgi:hypothetical protein